MREGHLAAVVELRLDRVGRRSRDVRRRGLERRSSIRYRTLLQCPAKFQRFSPTFSTHAFEHVVSSSSNCLSRNFHLCLERLTDFDLKNRGMSGKISENSKFLLRSDGILRSYSHILVRGVLIKC